MTKLHGSWIVKEENSYFFLWGETWRSVVTVEINTTTESIPLHPFCLDENQLLSLLKSHNLSLSNPTWDQEIITIPSQKSKKKEILPILSDVTPNASASLHQWQIQGFCLNAKDAIQFLQKLPLGNTDDYIGADLQYWCQIYRWSLDLLARCKFLPGINLTNEGKGKSYWQPLLDSNVDQARLAKFTHLMPPACYAYYSDHNTSESQELLLAFLASIVDTQLRSWVEISVPSVTSNASKWLQSLTVDNGDLKFASHEIKVLENAMQNWTLPVQDYLVSANRKLKNNQFRTCFSLIPPTSEQINSGDVDWQLRYGLQALDDTTFILDGAMIWQYSVEQLIWQGRTINSPQEIFLKGLGFASRLYEPIKDTLQEKQPLFCHLTPIQVYQFIRGIAWELQDNGLGVILPIGLGNGEGEKRLGIKIKAEVTPKKGERLGLKSLLNYKLELAIDDQTISKKDFERLLAAKSPLVEVNGSWIALQPADVRAAQEILAVSKNEMNLSVEDALRLTTGDTKVLAKLPVVGFQASGVLEEFINAITNNQSIQLIETSKNFKGELRPYQVKGVSWLAFLERWGLGACLADDMGLGKTIQLIAFLLNLKDKDALKSPTLLICPTSVVNNWQREVKKFAPTLSVFIHHGDKRSKGQNFVKNVNNKDLVISSYSLLYRDEKSFAEIPWQGIVLDEAQNIKNPQAKQSQVARNLKAGFRIALTGTPVENHLSDLWSILDFLNPSFLGNRQFFQRRFAIPIEKYGDRESLQILRSLISPFILRRLKTDKSIIQDLPEKQEMNVFCGLSSEQAQIYQNLVDTSLQEIEASEGIQRRGMILTLLLKLKQICNHPAQFFKEKTLDLSNRSGKLLRLEEMLEELIDEGDRALIFTQFSEWGKLLQPYLQKKLGSKILFLYGATRSQERQEMIDSFQNDPNGPRIFILSLKAGGTGLNLTRANHVFHIDRWWNPAVENQATDRAFRIGQKQNVQVHKFVCSGTLEERINDMIESKKQLADQTVETGENWLTELDTDQLRNLLLLDRSAVIDE